MYPVVLFSGPATSMPQARYLLSQAGMTLGTQHDAHGLPDTTEGTPDPSIVWLECVNVAEPTEEHPWGELLYGDRTPVPGGLEELGWQLRMYQAETAHLEPAFDPAAMFEQRLQVIEAFITGAQGRPDPGAVQAMAAQSPPYALQASSHSAELFRRAISSLLVAGGGIVLPGDLLVTQHGTPAMSIDVAAGEIWIPGTSSAAQGKYYCYNDGTVTLTIAASNPTNPRIDVGCGTVEDAQYAGASNDWKLQVITGTPAGSPSAPALPASSKALANVAVAALASTIVTGNLTDQRVRLSSIGGALYIARVWGSAFNVAGNGTATKVTLATVDYDPNANIATSAYTVPVTGWYDIKGLWSSQITDTTAQRNFASIYKNGSEVVRGDDITIRSGTANDVLTFQVSERLLLVAGDVIDLRVFGAASGSGTINGAGGSSITGPSLSVRKV